jgi:hypothetical protein
MKERAEPPRIHQAFALPSTLHPDTHNPDGVQSPQTAPQKVHFSKSQSRLTSKSQLQVPTLDLVFVLSDLSYPAQARVGPLCALSCSASRGPTRGENGYPQLDLYVSRHFVTDRKRQQLAYAVLSAQTIFFVSVHYVPELDHCVRCHAAHAVIQLGERVCTQIPRCKPYYVFWLLTDAGQEPAYAT